MNPEITREEVAELANAASDLDYHKGQLGDIWKARVKAAIQAMYQVAGKLDAQHDFGIYARED